MVSLEEATFEQIRDELEARSHSYNSCLVGERFGHRPYSRENCAAFKAWIDEHDVRQEGPTRCLENAVRALSAGLWAVKQG